MMFRTLLLASALLPVAAHAADNEIVVTGAGLGPTMGDTAYDCIIVDQNALRLSASARLEDALRDAAGFQQFRRSDARSAHPTSQGASLRGLGGNASSRALVLLDGVPLADPFGGWINWSALDPSRLQRAVVTRGGGNGSAGPGALAGTISLQSINAEKPRIEAEALYGSRDSVDGRVLAAGPLGDGQAMISARYQRGDGFIPIVKSQRGSADEPAPYEQASIAGRMVFPVGDKTELQANGLVFTDTRTRGTAFTDNKAKGADASLRLVGRGDWGWEASTWLQIRDFSSQFASVNAARTSSTITLDQYNVPATGVGGRFEISPPLGDAIDLRVGGDFRQQSGSTRELFTYVAGAPTRIRNGGGRTRVAGSFADISIKPSDSLVVTGGVRVDRWWIQNGHLIERTIATGALIRNDRPADRSGWETTARGGISWKAAEAVTLRGAAYLGWRLPTLNELYRPFRVGPDATAANPLLSPERLKGVDAGVEFAPLPGVRLNGTLFYNRLNNAIANVTLAHGPGTFPGVGFVSAAGVYRMRDNLDSVRAQGAEIEASVNLGKWNAGISYAYVDAKVRASGTALTLDGLRPAQTPKHQASGYLAWRDGERTVGVVVRYVSAQAEDDQNSRTLDNALTLDATLAWPILRNLDFVARAENVTNTRVEAGINSSGVIERATPRSFWAGFRYALR